MSLRGVIPRLSGRTGSGDIEVAGYLKKIDLRSGSGEVKATLEKFEKKETVFFDVKTGSGDITLKLPKNSQVVTSFLSGSGNLENQFEQGQHADFKLNVKTGSGDLKILKI